MRPSLRTLRNLGAAALFVASIGCAPEYETVDLETVSTPPAATTVRDSFIEIPAGVAVVIRADPRSLNRQEYDASYELDLFSSDRDIFTTYPRPSKSEFVIVGLDPGRACLEVIIDGHKEDCIDVTVLPPSI